MAINFLDSHSGASCCFKYGAQTTSEPNQNMHPGDKKKYCTKIIPNSWINLTTNNPIKTQYKSRQLSAKQRKVWASDTEQNVILHKTIRDTITTPEDHRNWTKHSRNCRHLRMATTLTHICVTRPQWFKQLFGIWVNESFEPTGIYGITNKNTNTRQASVYLMEYVEFSPI